MNLIFLRHGETDWNRAERIQGRTDIPLNETGIAQAEAARELLRGRDVDFIFTSPLIRAAVTAEIACGELIARGVPVIREPALTERNFGVYEGVTYAELEAKNLPIWKFSDSHDFPVPGGETNSEILQRISDYLTKLRREYRDKTVLIVAHGGVARCVNHYFKGRDNGESARRHFFPNGSVTMFSDEDNPNLPELI